MNKIEIKQFLGMDVRVVNNEWLVLKDFFMALGRVREDGTWTKGKEKTVQFLGDINLNHHLLCVEVKVKKGQFEKVECLKLETAPMLLTQFRPDKRMGEIALDKWKKFMIFVNDLLTSLEVHKFIITDIGIHKDKKDELKELGGTPVLAERATNRIMSKLLGIEDTIKEIKKEELKQFENQTTVDLIEVRRFVYDRFVNAYEFTNSHKTSEEMTLDLAKKKYKI